MAVAPVFAGDIIQTIIRQKCHGQLILNVLHWRCTTTPTDPEYFAAMDNLGNAVGNANNSIGFAMRELQSVDCETSWVQSQRIDPVRSVYTRTAVGELGTNAQPCTAQNVALVITKQGEQTGRGRSGSFHVGGISADAYEFGEATPNSLVLLNALASKLFPVLTPAQGGGEYEPGTYNPDAPIGQRFNPTLNAFPEVTLRVMRRRTVGVGQ